MKKITYNIYNSKGTVKQTVTVESNSKVGKVLSNYLPEKIIEFPYLIDRLGIAILKIEGDIK